jgi:hypothetical protein
MKHQGREECREILRLAAETRALVVVELHTGERFLDGVCEVFSDCGASFVVFHGRNCHYVDDIMVCAPLARKEDDIVA